MKIGTFYKSLSKKNKILFSAIFAILVLYIVFLIFFLANRKYSSLKIYDVSNPLEKTSLIALNKNARKSKIKQNDYAYFKFSENQKKIIKSVYENEDSVSLVLRINILPTSKQSILLDKNENLPFKIGFLYDDDFESNGKFKTPLFMAKKIIVSGDEKSSPEFFDISLSIQKSDEIEKLIPKGFFVYSTLQCFIKEACFAPSVIGFDNSSEISFYGFGCNGGSIDFSNKSFDFTGSSLVFSVQNTKNSQMPEYRIKLSKNEEYISTLENPFYVDFSFGGEKISVKNVKNADEVIIPSASLKNAFSRVEINSNDFCVKTLILKNVKNKKNPTNEVINPIKTDPGLILNYKMENWRNPEYELFEWDRFSRILFFDTKDFEIQGKFFTRLAFFVEKQGFKGRLLTDSELEGKHGYNAHDYSSESMARFFNKAKELNFPLNKYEELLKQILIQNDLFEQNDDGTVLAKEGGIVSISRESPAWSRKNLFAHEGWHMQFFRDEEFRNYVSAVFYTCDPNTRDFLIDYFRSQSSLGYDTNDDYLMHNEFMAYVMEKPTSLVAEDFVKKANWKSVNDFTPELCEYIRKTEGKGFEDISNALNDFVFDKYGIVAGNICLVNR